MEVVETAEQPNRPRLMGGAMDGTSSPVSDSRPASACRATETTSFVFALGRVEPRFSSPAVEKEFAQAVGRTDTAGQNDRQTLHAILADRANRYLARHMCWVFTIEGLETYILVPRDPSDVELLIDAVRSRPQPTDVDVVIGQRGPLAPAEACGGLSVPIVAFDNLYSFEREELIAAIPRPDGISEDSDDQFRATATELLDRIMQMADNAGATDEHRALNYLAVRYPAIYARTAEAHHAEGALTEVEVRPSRLSGTRRIVDTIFSYTHRRTDVTDKCFARVDVTEKFPFLVTKLSPYYERT